MKSRKHIVTVAVLAVVGIALIALPAGATPGRGGRGMGGCMGMGPAFTDEQLEQIEKIHDRYDDERAELTNRLKVLMLEKREALEADSPDFDAVERNMEEIADVRLELAKLRLRIHKEIRPLLDDDQKVLFDRGFRGAARGPGAMAGGPGHPGMMGRGCRMMGGCGMGRPGMMGAPGGPGMMGGGMGGPGMMGGPGAPGAMMGGSGGAMGGRGGMGRAVSLDAAAGPGRGMMPWCPFADDTELLDE